MTMSDDDQEKPHDPTPKRLEDARRKGQLPRSQDALTAAAYAGFLLAAIATGPAALLNSADAGMVALHRPEGVDAGTLFLAMLVPFLPLFLLPALPVLGLLLARRGIVFTGENLAPKLSRIDPIAAAKQRFGPEGLVDFLKGGVKMALVSLLLAVVVQTQLGTLMTAPMLDPGPGSALMMSLLLQFLALILLVSIGFAVVDLLWQNHRHLVRNRMSRQDLIEEQREVEGDPQTRATRRQRAQEIAMNRMLADVPKADVIVVNPQHYAVALKWHRARRQAPICVAKGVDEVALRIRAIAAENGVPIHPDPPTARALFASVEIGSEIRPDHYRPVAAAIRFAEAMRKRARR
jgi:flagellar biosynthesis protein FlhB